MFMIDFLKYKLLGIPLLVWGLQLLYVAVMLGLLVFIALATKLHDRSSRIILLVVVPYIIVMILIDIAWRVALKHHLPGWFDSHRM